MYSRSAFRHGLHMELSTGLLAARAVSLRRKSVQKSRRSYRVNCGDHGGGWQSA